MDRELSKVKLLKKNKFLNFYKAKYVENNKYRNYWFASRNAPDNLPMITGNINASAIEAFTYYKDPKDKKYYLVFIYEFRSAFNKYMLSFPAGLIEPNEDIKSAITREVSEEIGGKVKSIDILNNYPSPTSAGLSDEANVYAFVELEPGLHEQNLDSDEDIEVKVVPLDRLDITINIYAGSICATSLLGAKLLQAKLSDAKN